MIEQRGTSVRVHVRVQPRAATTASAGEMAGALKVRVAAPPVDGAANEELVRWIARTVRCARSKIRIVAGESARTKIIEIEDANADDVSRALLA